MPFLRICKAVYLIEPGELACASSPGSWHALQGLMMAKIQAFPIGFWTAFLFG
jgi:hypothetical protein